MSSTFSLIVVNCEGSEGVRRELEIIDVFHTSTHTHIELLYLAQYHHQHQQQQQHPVNWDNLSYDASVDCEHLTFGTAVIVYVTTAGTRQP